jgi:uncharacterized protein YpmS
MGPLRCILIVGLAVCASASVVDAEEGHGGHLRVQDLPDPVRTTVLKLANGRAVSEIEAEQERGKVVYKVKIGENEIVVHASGRVLSMKTEREEGKHGREREEQGKEDHDEEHR